MKNYLSRRVAMSVIVAGTITTLTACRGAPCNNCGAGYVPYGSQPAYGWQNAPAQPAIAPGGTIQPGYYQPGTVPVAPQQLPPGTVVGG